MDNSGSIQIFKKHGTNLSQMKWEDYAKEWELEEISWGKEWREPILSMQSNLRTYQRIELNKYATHKWSVKSDQARKNRIVQGSQSVEQMSATQGM